MYLEATLILLAVPEEFDFRTIVPDICRACFELILDGDHLDEIDQ